MKLIHRTRDLTTAIAMALSLAACGGGGSGTGSVTVGVTDAPVDGASDVVVQFTGVEIQPASGERRIFTFTDDDGKAASKTINLLDLQNGLRDLLLDKEQLPAGQYNWIRLLMTADADNQYDSYITIDGNQYELRIPSGAETGLKLNRPFTVYDGQTTDLTIDFDLRKSVHLPMNGDTVDGDTVYVLRPTLRLVQTAAAGSVAGTIDPTVFPSETCSSIQPPEAGYAVYVFQGTGVTPDDLDSNNPEPVTTAKATYDGSAYTYKVAFLEAGYYTVAVTCQADLDDPLLDDANVTFVGAADVTITPGAEIPYNFVKPTSESTSGPVSDPAPAL